MVSAAASRWNGLDRFADRLATLRGWRQWMAAGLCGALATLALPPLYIFPALVPAFCGLLWLARDTRGRRQAFAIGWWFGFVHFCSGLYWITNALLVDAEAFGWLAPFAVSGLSVGFALFPALVMVGYVAARKRGWGVGIAAPILFALLWTISEWLRGHILTGFPWNLMATTWVFSPAMSQPVALFGAYGWSFITVLAAAAFAILFGAEAAPRRPVIGAAVMVALLAGCGAGGAIRLAMAPAEHFVSGVQLRLVQANIDQSLKWRPDERVKILEKYLALSAQPAAKPITHVVWPETALPYLISREPELLAILARVVPQNGLLLTGAVRADPPEQGGGVWNSVHAIDASGRIAATYDKHHLVPFGEYVPLRGILPIDKITPGASDFSAGPGPRTLTLSGLPPVSPLICYEAIFPAAVATASNPRAQWLLNVTNDAWFGDSAGPRQHFASARLRAIEEGLPLVRAANTGISAVVDPYGRIVASLGLGREGVLDVMLPVSLPSLTPYGRSGDGVLIVVFGGALAMLAWARRRSA